MAGEIYFNNITGKFDWGSIIDQIIRLKSIPIKKLSKEAEDIKLKQTSLSKLNDAIRMLKEFLSNLEPKSITKSKIAVSSDEKVLIASASENAPEINLRIKVEQLAQREIILSRFSTNDVNANITWNDFSLRFAKNYGDYVTFNIQAGSGTLSDLVNRINQTAGDYIQASIYFDGNGYRLMLAEKNESLSKLETDIQTNTFVISEASAMNINGVWGLDYTAPLQFAKNAKIGVGDNYAMYGSGTFVESPSNTFENLVNGLTITVKSLGEAKVEVRQDFSKATNTLKDFVEKYNKVIDMVNKLTAKDAIFQGDYSIFGIKGQLTKTLYNMFAYDILNINEEGKIELNSSALSSLIQRDPEKFKHILEVLKKDMLSYLSGLASSLERFNQDYSSRVERINARVDYLKTQLIREEERLRLEYAKVEAFINKAQETMARLQAFIVSLSEMQGGNRR
ncbi:MAG: flagellar filament capping protein FliD [Archaeoglobaceae archaeon]